ncbi:MAG: Uncharacterised protein [Methanobacteriota archaeon]|nr:MAG: Uncharacterised protein [Euryarchaeota archaeon]
MVSADLTIAGAALVTPLEGNGLERSLRGVVGISSKVS